MIANDAAEQHARGDAVALLRNDRVLVGPRILDHNEGTLATWSDIERLDPHLRFEPGSRNRSSQGGNSFSGVDRPHSGPGRGTTGHPQRVVSVEVWRAEVFADIASLDLIFARAAPQHAASGVDSGELGTGFVHRHVHPSGRNGRKIQVQLFSSLAREVSQGVVAGINRGQRLADAQHRVGRHRIRVAHPDLLQRAHRAAESGRGQRLSVDLQFDTTHPGRLAQRGEELGV